jgi:hypothetical protein
MFASVDAQLQTELIGRCPYGICNELVASADPIHVAELYNAAPREMRRSLLARTPEMFRGKLVQSAEPKQVWELLGARHFESAMDLMQLNFRTSADALAPAKARQDI